MAMLDLLDSASFLLHRFHSLQQQQPPMSDSTPPPPPPRTGHARFRRAPPTPASPYPTDAAHSSPSSSPPSTLPFATAKFGIRDAEAKSHVFDPSSPSGTTAFARAAEGAHHHCPVDERQCVPGQQHYEGQNAGSGSPRTAQCVPCAAPCEENSISTSRRLSASNDDGGSVVNPKKPVLSRLGLPPLPPKRKCPSSSQNEGEGRRRCKSQRTCHCAHQNRTSRNRRILKISARGITTSGIPVDEFSWKKIGHKPIHGSPYPRKYYECDSVKGCSARKLVERSMVEADILIIIYDGEHNH